MGKRKVPEDPNPPTSKKTYKAQDPELRAKQITNMAMDRAEQMILDGTAPASLLIHFLQLASKKDALQQKIMEEQATLLKSKTGAIESNKDQERLTKEAMDAMTRYKGEE